MNEKLYSKNTPNLSEKEFNELSKMKAKFNHLFAEIMDNEDIYLLKIFPNLLDLKEVYEQLTDLKKCIDSFRPLNQSQLKNLQESFDTEYTYESNRIEGNTLSLMETDLVINKGITVSGKTMQEHQEAINHKEAVLLIRELAQNNQKLNETTLLKIHAIILHNIDPENAGFYRRDRVRIQGSNHVCPNPIKVPNLMYDLFDFYAESKDTMHPVELAANIHEKLVSIHPFIDGNGRTARLIINLILLQNGYPITIINSDRDKREEYYKALEAAHLSPDRENINNTKFQLLMAKYVKEWTFKYLNMFAPSIREDAQDKGYYFFKKIEPLLKL
ncbi:Fic domain protein, MA2133 type [hydrothermal vent metagenome]|uniref:Fic domain protein, MA2133 type n=1 Tax=hydrothermal vent metagenome TaxID=652676 RepID=A0A3B0VEN5_9ZZZZ